MKKKGTKEVWNEKGSFTRWFLTQSCLERGLKKIWHLIGWSICQSNSCWSRSREELVHLCKSFRATLHTPKPSRKLLSSSQDADWSKQLLFVQNALHCDAVIVKRIQLLCKVKLTEPASHIFGGLTLCFLLYGRFTVLKVLSLCITMFLPAFVCLSLCLLAK